MTETTNVSKCLSTYNVRHVMVNDADTKCEGHEKTQLSGKGREREELTEWRTILFLMY